MPAISTSSHKQSKITTIFLVVAILIVGVGIGFLYLTAGGEQDVRDRASELDVNTAPSKTTDILPTSSAATTKKSPLLCPVDGASCMWNATVTASGYRFKITDLTTGQLVKEGVTQETLVSFTSEVDHSYQCVVTGINSCGDGPQGKGESMCTALVSPTPTPSPTLTPTKGPSPTPTLTPTAGPSLTPTRGPSVTPTTVLVSNPTTAPTTAALPKAGFLTQSILIIAIGIVVLSLGFVL
jgi:hypothetical protein